MLRAAPVREQLFYALNPTVSNDLYWKLLKAVLLQGLEIWPANVKESDQQSARTHPEHQQRERKIIRTVSSNPAECGRGKTQQH